MSCFHVRYVCKLKVLVLRKTFDPENLQHTIFLMFNSCSNERNKYRVQFKTTMPTIYISLPRSTGLIESLGSVIIGSNLQPVCRMPFSIQTLVYEHSTTVIDTEVT